MGCNILFGKLLVDLTLLFVYAILLNDIDAYQYLDCVCFVISMHLEYIWKTFELSILSFSCFLLLIPYACNKTIMFFID